VGESERNKTVSEAGQESQTKDECCGKGQNIGVSESPLGEGQGRWQNEVIERRLSMSFQ
jgi:hypothetical protein